MGFKNQILVLGVLFASMALVSGQNEDCGLSYTDFTVSCPLDENGDLSNSGCSYTTEASSGICTSDIPYYDPSIKSCTNDPSAWYEYFSPGKTGVCDNSQQTWLNWTDNLVLYCNFYKDDYQCIYYYFCHSSSDNVQCVFNETDPGCFVPQF